MLFVFSIVFGSYLHENKSNHRVNVRYKYIGKYSALLILAIFSLPIIYGLIINFNLILNPTEYLTLVRGSNGLYRSVFGGDKVGYFITIFSMAVIFGSLVLGAQLFSVTKKTSLYYCSILILIVYSIVSQERFGLILIIYVILLGRLCSLWLGSGFFSKRFIIALSFMISIVMYMTIVRSGGISPVDMVKKYVIFFQSLSGGCLNPVNGVFNFTCL